MNILMYMFLVIVIVSHFGFMILEMFFWTHSSIRRLFGMSEEKAKQSKNLASNIGLYNGFLAAGLLWGLWIGGLSVMTFFLSCVIIAGIYGGLSAKRALLWIQGLPAAIALVLVWAHSSA